MMHMNEAFVNLEKLEYLYNNYLGHAIWQTVIRLAMFGNMIREATKRTKYGETKQFGVPTS